MSSRASGIEPPTEAIDAALAVLAAGGVVGLPTDTVYGLGVEATSAAAVARLFELKGRPDEVALAVLVADLAQALCFAKDDGRLTVLAEAFWPGPLTVVTHRTPELELPLGGDSSTIGLRCADDEFVRALARRSGPLAVTSANRHGEQPMTLAASLREAFPSVHVIDGGRRDAMPSAVVSLVAPEPVVLRAGVISEEEIRAVLTR